jgi:hypothetical protein
MARTRKAAKPTQAMAEATPEHAPVTESTPEAASGLAAKVLTEQSKGAAAGGPAYAADPHPLISVSLGEFRGGPAMHLLRSHRFRQMQIRFDREQPDEKCLAMLGHAGWTDRSQSEGIWTKQIDPDARWQSVQQIEREFKEVANAIRKGKGLETALEGMAMA